MQLQPVAYAHVAAGALVTARNCTYVHTGAGINTYTLGEGIDANESQIIVSLNAEGCYSIAHTSDTVKVVNTFTNAGVAGDREHHVTFCRAEIGTAF